MKLFHLVDNPYCRETSTNEFDVGEGQRAFQQSKRRLQSSPELIAVRVTAPRLRLNRGVGCSDVDEGAPQLCTTTDRRKRS